MKTDDAPEVYGYTVFCDDIRVEVGNRLTFVGAYSGPLIVPSFPFLLPKLAMNVVYMQKYPHVVTPTKFMVFLPNATGDEPSFQIDIPPEVQKQLEEQNQQRKNMRAEENTFATFGMQFGVINLTLNEPGLIRVRAVRRESLVRLGSLTVALSAPTAGPFSVPVSASSVST